MIEQSEKRCRRCSKRMMQEADPYYLGPGVRLVFECWSCDWVEREVVQPLRPTLKVIQGGRSGADRLKAVRLGDAS